MDLVERLGCIGTSMMILIKGCWGVCRRGVFFWCLKIRDDHAKHSRFFVDTAVLCVFLMRA